MAKEEKKAIGKKTFSLDAYKVTNKLNDGVKDKPLEYIQLSPAFQTVTGISIVKGIVNLLRGFSNTGKSTALIESAIGAQRQGILPIIIDTENGWNWEHARAMGFEFTDVQGEVTNEETGEVTTETVNYEGFFIYINNDYLIENFGKKRDKNRDEAVIEDVAEFMNKTLDDQNEGNLEYELLFCFDSIGTLDCEQCITAKSRNNMWNAGAYEAAFKSLINYRIPASRKTNKKFTNTLVAVNKIWIDNMGMGVVMNKGGNAFMYGARLVFHFGGVQSQGIKKLIAKANGKDYHYGTQTKVSVEKNHINGTSNNGVIISTAHGFKMPEEMEEYKKQYKNYFITQLGMSLNTEVTFAEEDLNPGE